MIALPAREPLLIRGGQLVTMNARREILHADLLVEDGRISRIGPLNKSIRIPRGVRTIDARGRAITPGFIQSHVHLCQVLFRNQADGLELLEWLSQRIWPFEAAHDARSLQFSARLGIAELLLSGTTAILDMGTVRHTEQLFRAVEASGIRYAGGKCLMDTGYAGLREETNAALRETEVLGERWHGKDSNRISYALCPRFVLSCSEPLWRSVGALSAGKNWIIHTHASENRTEVKEVRAAVGDDNVAWFHELGLGSPRLVLAHCVHLTTREEKMIAKSGSSAVHCPGANLKLASGVAPIPRMLERGINVGIGSDGAPCNNTLDALRELRLAATLHLPRFGPTSMPAAEVLAMATINGARALGQSDQLGSIEVGKKADLTLLDLTGPHLAPPAPDLHATIVYGACASDVTDVIVDGRHLVRDRRLLTLDAGALARNAPRELARLQQRLSQTRMNPAVSEWSNLFVRWFHIFTGILWIGSTWYFTWLDFRVREAEARAAKTGEPALVWMVHSGGFYRVEKLTAPEVDPKLIHWFKWEALFTWISGILMLGIVYYSTEGILTDSDVSNLTHLQAVGLCVAVLIGGWVVYDLIFLTPIAKSGIASLVIGYALTLGVAWFLLHEISGRAAYLHIGALFGTIMTLNVWMRILPAQKRLVRALKDKTPPDQKLAERAKLRSKHNTFLVVPLVFTMISNHFPTASYGNDHSFLVLAGLIALGWAVAGFVRGKV